MRNLFDQYHQTENRITHALMTCLDRDRELLRLFLVELVKTKPLTRAEKLHLIEQRLPGGVELSESDIENVGLPDGWIFDKGGWCIFIESKVQSAFKVDQINRHIRRAERLGFKKIISVAIVAVLPANWPPSTVLLEWRDIYAWLQKHCLKSMWASELARYLEVSEMNLVDQEKSFKGSLTTFAGFPFGKKRPYSYREGKRILALACRDLREKKTLVKVLGMNPRAPGRPAITGFNGTLVWDFLSIANAEEKNAFTHHPHLTLAIKTHAIEAMITIPNAIRGKMRSELRKLGEEGFFALVSKILGNMAPMMRKNKGCVPTFRGIQRRYPSQNADPYIDAILECDLRTAIPSKHGPKAQSKWLSAGYASFVNRRGINYQMQLGTVFPYDECPELNQKNALELVSEAWLACKPIVDMAR